MVFNNMQVEGRSIGASRSTPAVGAAPQHVNLREVHYEAMRKQRETRERQRLEREGAIDRNLEAARFHRPASASSTTSSRKANNTFTHESQSSVPAAPEPAKAGIGGYPEPSRIPMGDFGAFVASGEWRAAKNNRALPPGNLDADGNVVCPRKAFTTIP